MYYLSIDSGTKNIGIVFYKFNSDYLVDINKKIGKNFTSIKDVKYDDLSKDELYAVNTILDSIIDIKFFKLVNIIPDEKLKDTDIINRSTNLKKELVKIDNLIYEIIEDEKFKMQIEYQMNINNCSLAVMNQIIYHYSIISNDSNVLSLSVIPPSKKNKLTFHKLLDHKKFIQKYNTNYTANKMHTKYNLLYYIVVFERYDLISNYSLKKIDDLADCLFQSLTNLK